MQNLTEKWALVLKEIEHEVTAVSFDLWIKNLEPVDITDDKIILFANTQNAKNQVLKLHKEKLIKAISTIFDTVSDFVIIDPTEKSDYLQNKEKHVEEQVVDTPVEKVQSIFNEKYTFNNFVVGKSNQFVYAAAKSVAEDPGNRFNPLFIYGGSGLGKTHLLHAIGNYIKSNNPKLNVIYVTCETFTNDYLYSLRSNKDNSTKHFRDKYRSCDVLMIDDIQFITGKTSTQEEFFHTFNDLFQNNKQIIICSDRHPREIETLEERLRTRFVSGLTQDIQQPDFETRLAILQKKVQIEKYSVEPEVLEYIAKNVDTNIRELEGALKGTYFHSKLFDKPSATLDDAVDTIKETVETTTTKLSPERIIEVVCKYYNVQEADLVGKKRNKEIVDPRQTCMYLITDMIPDMPLLSIGRLFGGRDHTTVIHARDKIAENLKSNTNLKTTVNDLKAMIKSNKQ
jgi:chromosomal replication initiator protein